MKASVLDIGAKPLTDLKPGETGLRLKDDPYYGKVDLGASQEGDDDDAKTREFERKERDRISQLPADERGKAEEKLGRDLAKRQKASGKSGKSGDKSGMDKERDFPASANRDDLQVALGYLEETIDSGAHILSGEEQSRIEVLTGKRLQQRPPQADPREPEDVTEGIDGEAGAREASSANAMEPPERDRDKTKAAKPGESAKSEPTRDRDKS